MKKVILGIFLVVGLGIGGLMWFMGESPFDHYKEVMPWSEYFGSFGKPLHT